MKKLFLLQAAVIFIITTASAQVTSDKVTTIFNGKLYTADKWLPDPGGQSSTVTVNSDFSTTFVVDWIHSDYFPMAGILYVTNPIDASKNNKLVLKVKLRSGNKHNFKVEPIARAAKVVDGTPASFGWPITMGVRDTVRLNGNYAKGSNPEFHATASTGVYQLVSYKIKQWQSTFPAKNVWLDSTKIIGVNVYFGWETSGALTDTFTIGWAVFADSTLADADIGKYVDSTLNTGTAIRQNQLSQFSVSPNPVYNELRFTNDKEITTAVITNTLGEEVLRVSNLNSTFGVINVNSLRSGMYVITAVDKNGKSYVSKFLKQ